MIAGQRRAAYGAKGISAAHLRLRGVLGEIKPGRLGHKGEQLVLGDVEGRLAGDVAQDAHRDHGLADEHAGTVEKPGTPPPGPARASAVSPWPVHHVEHRLSALRSAVSKGAGSPAFMPSGVASMMMSAPAMACRDVA